MKRLFATAPIRIQRRRAKGWTMPENTVYVGRGSPWGNPFVVGRDGTRAHVVLLYRYLLSGLLCLSSGATWQEQEKARNHVAKHAGELRGKNLACWCSIADGKPCHADVLLEIANR